MPPPWPRRGPWWRGRCRRWPPRCWSRCAWRRCATGCSAAANRLVYGQRDEPYQALASLASRLEGQIPPAEVVDAVVEGVADALRLPYVALSVPRPGQPALVAARGQAGGEVFEVELVHRDETVGRLAVSADRGQRLRGREQRLLRDLARHAAAVIAAARLSVELARVPGPPGRGARTGTAADLERAARRSRPAAHRGVVRLGGGPQPGPGPPAGRTAAGRAGGPGTRRHRRRPPHGAGAAPAGTGRARTARSRSTARPTRWPAPPGSKPTSAPAAAST